MRPPGQRRGCNAGWGGRNLAAMLVMVAGCSRAPTCAAFFVPATAAAAVGAAVPTGHIRRSSSQISNKERLDQVNNCFVRALIGRSFGWRGSIVPGPAGRCGGPGGNACCNFNLYVSWVSAVCKKVLQIKASRQKSIVG